MISLLSGEWILTRLGLDNGGDVVFYRAFWTAIWMFALTLVTQNAIDPSKVWIFDAAQLQRDVADRLPWFGAIFAAAYAAYYARFSSQWNYLANLYNLIKAAEVNGVDSAGAMAQWKAGFIEDADDLHLATKRMFAYVIRAWADDPDVKSEFIGYTVGHERRLRRLLKRVRAAIARAEHSYRPNR